MEKDIVSMFITDHKDSKAFSSFLHSASRNPAFSLRNNISLCYGDRRPDAEVHGEKWWSDRGFAPKVDAQPYVVYTPILEKKEVKDKNGHTKIVDEVKGTRTDIFYSTAQMVDKNGVDAIPSNYAKTPVEVDEKFVVGFVDLLRDKGFKIIDAEDGVGGYDQATGQIRFSRTLPPGEAFAALCVNLGMSCAINKDVKNQWGGKSREGAAKMFATVLMSRFGVNADLGVSTQNFVTPRRGNQFEKIYRATVSEGMKEFDKLCGVSTFIKSANSLGAKAEKMQEDVCAGIFESAAKSVERTKPDVAQKISEEGRKAQKKRSYADGGLQKMLKEVESGTIPYLDREANNAIKCCQTMILAALNERRIMSGKIQVDHPSFEVEMFCRSKTRGREDLMVVFFYDDKEKVKGYEVVSKNAEMEKVRNKLVMRALALGTKSVSICENGMFDHPSVEPIMKALGYMDVKTKARVRFNEVVHDDTSYEMSAEDKDREVSAKITKEPEGVGVKAEPAEEKKVHPEETKRPGMSGKDTDAEREYEAATEDQNAKTPEKDGFEM
jgi:hypothetical protein